MGRWTLVEESRCGGGGFTDGLEPLNDGRGILDLRGGTGGTGFVIVVAVVVAVVVAILLLVNELVEVDEIMDLFNERAWEIDVDSLSDGATSPLLIGIGGCGRPLVRNVVLGFFNDVEFVVDGNFERFIFILVMTVGLDLFKLEEILLAVFDASDRFPRNVGVGRGKSVSSKFNESVFDVADNELALRWSRWKEKQVDQTSNLNYKFYRLVLMA